MINYWWVTRPKRILKPIPEVLTTFAGLSLDQEWEKQRGRHLSLEDSLEQAGLKRIGDRRDQTGGGGRTYKTWLFSLGLIFTHEDTGQIKLTLAGEAIMNGASPVEVLKAQVLKYQFPSPFSLAPKARKSHVSDRFRIRPFRFLLKLLMDSRIHYITQEELAKIIIVEAENESDRCFERIVNRLQAFRNFGDDCLDERFFEKYAPSSGIVNPNFPFRHLEDVANTLLNWIEYTQLARREDGKLVVLEEKVQEIELLLHTNAPFIDRPEQQEYFQRKYGLDPWHRKDTRNLLNTGTITTAVIERMKIQQAFIVESLKHPISKVTSDLVEKIVESTGIRFNTVEENLQSLYPHGAIGAFMANYFEMAFKGRDEAIDFELATVEVFQNVFGFEARHVGPMKLNPDVFVLSNQGKFVGIVDNKAYSKYSISNDHYNRMVHNYIPSYKDKKYPLSFFTYIAGGFGQNMNARINDISKETSIGGSAISVSTFISLIQRHQELPLSHNWIKSKFSINRIISMQDFD